MASEVTIPTCDTDGCDTEVPGLEDGWESSDGTLRCADDWDYWTEHGHWPDEDADCITCIREEEGDDAE